MCYGQMDQQTNGIREPLSNGRTKHLTSIVAATAKVRMLLQFKAIFTMKKMQWTNGSTKQWTAGLTDPQTDGHNLL